MSNFVAHDRRCSCSLERFTLTETERSDTGDLTNVIYQNMYIFQSIQHIFHNVDDTLVYYTSFNSISVIWKQWKGNNERLRAMKPHTIMSCFLLDSNLEPCDPGFVIWAQLFKASLA